MVTEVFSGRTPFFFANAPAIDNPSHNQIKESKTKSAALMFSLFTILFAFQTPAFSADRLTPYQLEQARGGALVIVEHALLNDRRGKYSALFSAVRQKLQEIVIFTPDPGSDYVSCGPQTLSYVEMYKSPTNVYLCALSLEGSVEKLEQTLIHESSHLIGNESECDASKVELLVMNTSKTPLRYTNNYLTGCGLHP